MGFSVEPIKHLGLPFSRIPIIFVPVRGAVKHQIFKVSLADTRYNFHG
jgi:hypothetical protein